MVEAKPPSGGATGIHEQPRYILLRTESLNVAVTFFWTGTVFTLVRRASTWDLRFNT